MLKLTASERALGIQSFSITLPGGLRFATSHHRLAKGLSIKESQHPTLTARKVRLTVTLPVPTTPLAIGLRAPALLETRSLRSRINQLHKANRHAAEKGVSPSR
jgi:hypothetical protein